MKTNGFKKLIKNILTGILMTLMVFSFSSCAVKSSFSPSAIVPAAQGKIKVKRDKNQNYNIQIQVSNLAEVEKLQSSKHNYVVWMDTDQGKTENLGQLNTSTGLLSKKLKASLETVSSYKPARIYITAEDNGDVQNPGEQVVLSTTNF